MAPSDGSQGSEPPEGIFSLLDTDLYKLTMQCAVLKYFPDVDVTYSFTNRTHDMRLSRVAYHWLQRQIMKLGAISVSQEELQYLRSTCSYLNEPYLQYLAALRLNPQKQIRMSFQLLHDNGSDDDLGDVHLEVQGRWADTILYEIPLLALTSEAYFKFRDRDWTHQNQEERAYNKAISLLQHGCIFSEFGSRRRRDYHTHELVLRGLLRASEDGRKQRVKGKLAGTSNVHFAMRYGLAPVGTVAHEWFMGIAAITDDYEGVNETALRYWVGCFGVGVLGIALTDTFGTPAFLEAFRRPLPDHTTAALGGAATLSSTAASSTMPVTGSLSETNPPIQAPISSEPDHHHSEKRSYAQVFAGVRQDSGDPAGFIKLMREFYDQEGIKDKKTIVFSDSLNIELCVEYMQEAEDAGFQPTFGVGTFLTNDFKNTSSGAKSVPLNIVIKLSSAAGRPAVKISDNIGKNTGDQETVEQVKRRLGYIENGWEGGDEQARWGRADVGGKSDTNNAA
ncbi:MAG: nicotinate phosphoribosyltransferase [Caeruleum heppii]|nr:MAG: nicotinate phosphoribosyltransferase [Caeruleum heppii]